MNVFISWSGEPSRSFALALRDWLKMVLQASKPWMSEKDIESGVDWRGEISKILDQCDYGIICVTRSNQDKPWLNFEAGAIAKKLDSARVCPLLLDVTPSDLRQPLGQFQSRTVEKSDIHRLISDINLALDAPIETNAVTEIFEAFWPKLQDKIASLRSAHPAVSPVRTQEDKIDEILSMVRALSVKNSETIASDRLVSEYSKDLVNEITKRYLETTGKIEFVPRNRVRIIQRLMDDEGESKEEK